MAGKDSQPNNIYSENDALDINELASLNEDISPELIEQLQNQLTQNAMAFTGKSPLVEDDSELFEEVSENNESVAEPKPEKDDAPNRVNIDDNIDDNFMKKYKAKLNREQQAAMQMEESSKLRGHRSSEEEEFEQNSINTSSDSKIENLTSGNIIEKPISKEQLDYNESLDFLDNNVKYSKYVVYIDPENAEFIESLTVRERKNLINKILREQDDIAISKRRFDIVKSVFKHVIIAVITITISVPVLYHMINASLEASINNYRKSQTIFKSLYKEKGKIKQIKRN
ncbi:hypothetical protein IJD34_06585 [bacterium]|nr:hypothetical protein [bacterium]